MVTLWVTDASPMILLVRVGQLDLLQRLGPRMVIFAKTQGLISVARPIVEGLRQNGMLLSDKVMNQALRRLESSQWSRCARTRTARSLCPNVLRNASYGVWVEREGAVRLRQVSANDLAACYQENFISFEFLRVLWSINTALLRINASPPKAF